MIAVEVKEGGNRCARATVSGYCTFFVWEVYEWKKHLIVIWQKLRSAD